MGKTSKRKQSRPRVFKLSEALRWGFAAQLEAFRKKFGRDMGPGDPIFFDPHVESPRPMSEEELRRELHRAATESGIDPAVICALDKTGMLLADGNENQWSEEELAKWDRAIGEYYSQISRARS